MSRSETRRLRCASCPATIVLSFENFTAWSDNPKRYIDAMGEKEGKTEDGKWRCWVHKGGEK